jgi:hypothetical protein
MGSDYRPDRHLTSSHNRAKNLMLLLCAQTLTPAATLAMRSCSVTFSEKDLCFSEYGYDDDTFDYVGLGGIYPQPSPAGFPSVPVERFYVLISQDRRCAAVNIRS